MDCVKFKVNTFEFLNILISIAFSQMYSPSLTYTRNSPDIFSKRCLHANFKHNLFNAVLDISLINLLDPER